MAKIFVCGDVVNMFSPESFIGEKLGAVIRSADYAIANLEGCEFSGAGTVPKMMQYPGTMSILRDSGFNMLLMANNHIADYGENALRQTIAEANSLGFECIGAGLSYDEAYRPVVINIEGTRVGMLNLCEAHPHFYHNRNQKYGYAWIGDPNIKTRIEGIRNKSDKVIAFIHGGLEHCTCPLGFYRDYYRWLCDCGVDVVIGGHPHISQGIEWYNEQLICYSLGNFFFPRQLNSDSIDIENHSFSVILSVDKYLTDYEVVYHKMDNLITEIESVEESPVRVEELSEILSSEKYEQIHAETIKKYYEGLVNNLYHSSLNTMREKDSLLHRFKGSLRYLLSPHLLNDKSQQRNKTFVHLINNETYRYIVNEYLKDSYAREHE